VLKRSPSAPAAARPPGRPAAPAPAPAFAPPHGENAHIDPTSITVAIPGVISFFDFSDPDGNGLSCYQVSAE
jgi:hypothetical protein